MPESGVRPARTSDADDVGAVTVRAWRHRFAGVLPHDVLESLDPLDLGTVWASGLLNPPTPFSRLFVAVDDGLCLGYAAVGPCSDPDAEDDTAELLALEVLPEHQRQGHGSRLMAAAMELLAGAGMRGAVTWCPLVDEPRRAFLQSAGWGPDTAYRDVLVGVDADGNDMTVREVRLVTALVDP